jgi:hypothetical protein
VAPVQSAISGVDGIVDGRLHEQTYRTVRTELLSQPHLLERELIRSVVM